MPSLILYNYTMSICSMKTRLAMAEFGLAFEDRQVDIGFALENMEPDYVKLNRRGVVPTLIADGEITTNSAAIVQRLAALSGRGSPTDPANLAAALDWFGRGDDVNFQVITYGRKGVPRGEELLVARRDRAALYADRFPELRDVYLEIHDRIVNHADCSVDAAGVAKAEADMRNTLDALDRQLADNSFIIGEEYTIADIMWTVILARLEMLNLTSEIKDRPNLLAYYDKVKRRPSFEAARVMPNWKGGI